MTEVVRTRVFASHGVTIPATATDDDAVAS
jgi:hypothetical protein